MSSENKAIETAPKLKAPAPKVVVPAPKIARPSCNGISRPKPGGNCFRVWEIADEITEKLGEAAPRKDVLERVTKASIPLATGATQYNLWRNFNGLSGRLVPKVTAVKVKLPKPPTKKPAGKVGSNKPPTPGSAKMPKPPTKKPATPAPVAPATPAPATVAQS